MKPVVLLIGRLPNVIGDVARQLDAEPHIACAIMGAGLGDKMRGELVGIIAARRPDICIHLKDRASGPEGLVPFVERVVRHELLEPHDAP